MVKKTKPLVTPPNQSEAETLTLEIMRDRILHLEVCNQMLIKAVQLLKDQVKNLVQKAEKDERWTL